MIIPQQRIILISIACLIYMEVSAQGRNLYLVSELGITLTTSSWEGKKPNKNDIKLKSLTHFSPNLKLSLEKKMFKKVWISVAAKLQNASWRYRIYYRDLQNNIAAIASVTSGYSSWQFPVVCAYEIFGRPSIKGDIKWLVFSGLIPSISSPNSDFDSQMMLLGNKNLTEVRGYNFLIPLGIKYWTNFKYDSKNKLSFSTCLAIGTRIVFINQLQENVFRFKSNGSYFEFTVGYLYGM